MTDNVAILAGYTQEIVAFSVEHELYLLVKPGTDLDSEFRAWDTEAQEYIRVNGWLFNYEEAELPAMSAFCA